MHTHQLLHLLSCLVTIAYNLQQAWHLAIPMAMNFLFILTHIYIVPPVDTLPLTSPTPTSNQVNQSDEAPQPDPASTGERHTCSQTEVCTHLDLVECHQLLGRYPSEDLSHRECGVFKLLNLWMRVELSLCENSLQAANAFVFKKSTS